MAHAAETMPNRQSPSTHPLLERSDEELARESRAGSLLAFETVVSRFEPRLMAFLLPRCVNRDDAEDALQQTFLAVWRCLHQYDPERPFAPWVFTIAARIVIKTQQRDRRRTARERSVANDDHENDSSEFNAERDNNIWMHAARVLTNDAYTALWLRYAENMEPQHIGPAIGKRPGAVRVLLHRARQRLASTLPASMTMTSPLQETSP